MNELKGIWAAALTPVTESYSVHNEALTAHCNSLLKRGCNGVVLFGITGEGPSFSIEERIATLKTLIKRGIPPEKILMGNGSANLSDTIALAGAVVQSKCADYLVAPPSFFKNVPEEGILSFYQALLSTVPDLRILLYHIPQYSGVSITPYLIEKLYQQFPKQILGLKESEGNPALIDHFLAKHPYLSLLIGNEKFLFDSLLKGASGAISGLANLFPEQLYQIYLAAQRGEKKDPTTLSQTASKLKQYPFIPAAKAILEKEHGPAWHHLIPPLMPLTPQEKESLFAVL